MASTAMNISLSIMSGSNVPCGMPNALIPPARPDRIGMLGHRT